MNLELEIQKEEQLEQINKSTPKSELKTKLDYILAGFISKPLEFLGKELDIDEYVENETGFCLLPKTKEERQVKADDILKKIAEQKTKKLKKDKQINLKASKTKKELISKLKAVQKELNSMELN